MNSEHNFLFLFPFTFQLGLPLGSIKACVLIESIFCSFELDQILYELRQHSAGLNCGMWDYSASFVSNFGMYTANDFDVHLPTFSGSKA